MRKLLSRRVKVRLPFDREYFMAFLSGSEGGVATTGAIICGLLISETDTKLVVTGALIAFIVQAFNSAAVQFLSERTNDEIDQEDTKRGYAKPLMDSSLQFISHTIMSVLVILPVTQILNIQRALLATIGTTLTILFFIGAYRAYVVKKSILRDAFETSLLGAAIINAGIIAGLILLSGTS